MSQALQQIESPTQKSAFIKVYQAVHKVSETDAANYFEVELFDFKSAFEQTPALQKCTPLSIASTFLEVISNGLSFDKSAKHVYIMPRSVKVGDQFETRLSYSYAADGLIYLATAAGSITGCSTPVIVYEGDHIEVKDVNGQCQISHARAIPRISGKIVGGFCHVITKGGRESFYMDIKEVERLAGYSAKANRGAANALYTSDNGQIDAGFFSTKIVKAALKNYRKKRTLNDNYFDDELIEDQTDLPFVEAEPSQPIESSETLAF